MKALKTTLIIVGIILFVIVGSYFIFTAGRV